MNNPVAGYLDRSGFRLNYSIEGQGIPVLIPGSVLYDQRAFSPGLRQHLQLIFLDHRGFVPPPEHDWVNADFDLPVLLEDIEMARQYFQLEKFFILGHSGHGFLAIEYAKQYPGHIEGVAMVASAPSNSDKRRNDTNTAFEKNASADRKRIFEKNREQLPAKLAANPAKRFMSYLLAAAPQSWYDPHFDATPLWEGVYTNMQAIDHIWGEVFRDIDITKNIEQFSKPVWLALGKYDYLTGPPEVWKDVLPKFNTVTVTVFEKSAHCPQYEEPALFNKELLQWIQSVMTK